MSKIKVSTGRRVFVVFNYIVLSLLMVATLYPFLYVLAVSLSDPSFILRGKVSIIPQGFTTEAYQRVFKYPFIWTSYRNTIFYTVAGTAINIILTACGAYPLSRKRFSGRKFGTFIVLFSMLFTGGMIPTYLVVKGLGLYNTVWAILLPGAVYSWNLIVMRTFFQQIPEELEEAAKIDGCNEIHIFFRIIIPLSIPAMMTIGLFYAVEHWNSFFNALIYLKDKELFPLQIILRQIVIRNETDEMMGGITQGRDVVGESIKHATIIVATIPILLVYPFIQRYFVKGAMIGAVKG